MIPHLEMPEDVQETEETPLVIPPYVNYLAIFVRWSNRLVSVGSLGRTGASKTVARVL